MSSEIHEIRLIAKDGASQVFKMAGTNAERMNQQIERSNQRTKRSWDEIGRTAQKAGATIGATAFLAIRAANKSEESQVRLKQSIENTGKSYEEYADAVNKASKAAIKKAFDDEDAADAISKLTQATGDASKAIDDLSIAEDIARARGIDLASATNIVVAAEQGRLGALKRMGIAIDDNATKEEALAALRTKFAGQADAYATTNAATWDRARIQAENALESLGGKLADHQALILSVSAAWTAFGSVLGSLAKSLGASGMGALFSGVGIAGVLGMAGYAAAGGGSSPGTSSFNSIFNTLFGGVAGGLNWMLPGNPLNTQKYTQAMTANSIEDAVKGLIYNGTNYTNDAQIYQALISAGVLQGGLPLKMKNGQVTGMDMSADDWNNTLAGVNQTAASMGMTPGQYLSAAAQQAGLVQDPVSGMWGYPEQIRAMQNRRNVYLGDNQGATGPNPPPGWIKAKRPVSGAYGANSGAEKGEGALARANSSEAAGNYPSASGMGQGLAQQTEALKAQYGEWYKLAGGIANVRDALHGFELAQQTVMKGENKYSGEISDFTAQQNALTAAYDLINQKKEQGITLTKQEQEYLDKYPERYERITGGINDATEAQGMLAGSYIDNMKAADAFKSSQDATTASTTALNATIIDLINALAGVPRDVTVAVNANLDPFYNIVNNLLGQMIGSAYINVYANRIGFGATPEQHGGLTMAQHGYAGTSRSIMVGEAGPEILDISGGSTFVTPAAASKFSNKKRKMDGDGMTVSIAHLTVVANSPKQFGDAMRSYALAGSRN